MDAVRVSNKTNYVVYYKVILSIKIKLQACQSRTNAQTTLIAAVAIVLMGDAVVSKYIPLKLPYFSQKSQAFLPDRRYPANTICIVVAMQIAWTAFASLVCEFWFWDQFYKKNNLLRPSIRSAMHKRL